MKKIDIFLVRIQYKSGNALEGWFSKFNLQSDFERITSFNYQQVPVNCQAAPTKIGTRGEGKILWPGLGGEIDYIQQICGTTIEVTDEQYKELSEE